MSGSDWFQTIAGAVPQNLAVELGGITDKITKGTKLTVQDCSLLTMASIIRMNEVLPLKAEIADLRRELADRDKAASEREKRYKEEVLTLSKKLVTCEKRIASMEMKEVSKNVLLRGLPVHQKAEREKRGETPAEVKEQVNTLLNKLKIGGSCRVSAVDRFGSKKPGVPGIVRLSFEEMTHKSVFYENLKNLPSTGLKIGVSNEFPSSMREELKALESEAYELRKAKNVRTKIIFKDGSLVIKTKPKTGGAWTLPVATAGSKRTHAASPSEGQFNASRPRNSSPLSMDEPREDDQRGVDGADENET